MLRWHLLFLYWCVVMTDSILFRGNDTSEEDSLGDVEQYTTEGTDVEEGRTESESGRNERETTAESGRSDAVAPAGDVVAVATPTVEADQPELVESLTSTTPAAVLTTESSKMTQSLTLLRPHCNLELNVHEAESLQTHIVLSSMTGVQRGAGQCQITVRGGQQAGFLAVILSSLLCAGGDILRVVLIRDGLNYTMKEEQMEQYPVLLTEAQSVYIILSYNDTQRALKESSFDLEVFQYRARDNELQDLTETGYPSSGVDVEQVYFTTLQPPQEIKP